jgi:hypothetical protein
VLVLASYELLCATASRFGDGDLWRTDLRYDVWCVVQAIVIEAHEGLLIFLVDGGLVVLGMELAVVLSNVLSPFVGDIRLELRCLGGARSFVNVDACAQRQLVWVVSVCDGGDKVSKWILVDIRKVVRLELFGFSSLDPRWEGERPRLASEVGRHC